MEGVSAWAVPSYTCYSEGRGTSPGWITITSAAVVSWITPVFFFRVTTGAVGTAISISNSCGSGYALRIWQHPKMRSFCWWEHSDQELQSRLPTDAAIAQCCSPGQSDPEFLQHSCISAAEVDQEAQWEELVSTVGGRGGMGVRGGLGTVSGSSHTPNDSLESQGKETQVQTFAIFAFTVSFTLPRCGRAALTASPSQARDTSSSKSL